MKKLFLILLALSLVFCLSSCKIGEDGRREDVPEEAKEIASQFEEQNTRKDSAVLENLSAEQKKFLDSIGETVVGTKLVAYSDATNITLVYSCEFTDNIVSKVTVYHIIKNDSYFNAVKSGMNANSGAEIDEENRVIKADKTKEFASRTYDEIKKEFSKYTIVE